MRSAIFELQLSQSRPSSSSGIQPSFAEPIVQKSEHVVHGIAQDR
jgi:hypothetical protein